MKKASTAVKILVIALIISAPLFLYDTLQKQSYTNATLSQSGMDIYYNVTRSTIVIKYDNIFNDAKEMDTSIYSNSYNSRHSFAEQWTIFENITYNFPMEVEFKPPDKDDTYSIKATVLRAAGNYTYTADIIPSSEEKGV